jgi:hypothetical protein
MSSDEKLDENGEPVVVLKHGEIETRERAREREEKSCWLS